MFEKEAIKHAFENTIGIECLDKPIEDFSYEELSDELQEKAFDFQKGAEFGYNKANEWHYVKDGDLPKDDKQYLVLFCYNHKGKKEMSCGIRDNLYSAFEHLRCYTEQIIAWKEIVLPELPKESE